MTKECGEYERLLSNSAQSMRLLGDHARDCRTCREKLDFWNGLSTAARSLQTEWDSPRLWTRIRSDLENEQEAPGWKRRSGFGDSSRGHRTGGVSLLKDWLISGWQVAAVAALLLVTLATAWVVLNSSDPEAERRLLTEQTLDEVEGAEKAYIDSIEKLGRLLEPSLRAEESPLQLHYREKLTLIDEAIQEYEAQIELNRYNAHLRRALLGIYREKQQTLQTLAGVIEDEMQ